jgi:catechol 2,3-dioxygenase-like lactoylglutathione lyase family enzyme
VNERVLELDHVQVAAPPHAEERARSFYGDLLGLPEVVKPAALRDRGGVWFRLGAQQLRVGGQEPDAPAGGAHPVLRVRDGAAFDAFARRLAASGAPIAWDDAIPGRRRLHTADPWGHRVVLLADASAPAHGTLRIFLAGASGVIGSRLLRLLVAEGHAVAGMTRTPAKAEALRDAGAEPVVCDVYDAAALSAALRAFAPELVIDQLTDLPDASADLAARRADNARLRRVGTRHLLAAANAAAAAAPGGAPAPRVIAQTVAWEIAGDGGDAVREREQAVLDAAGVVVRYGQFYGPGTYYETEPPPHPRVHVDDAARRTLPALAAPAGVLVIAEAALG